MAHVEQQSRNFHAQRAREAARDAARSGEPAQAARKLSAAGLLSHAAGSGEPTLWPHMDLPQHHRTALLRNGANPHWVAGLHTTQLGRQVRAEAAWGHKFGPTGADSVLPLDPFGHGSGAPAALRGCALSPFGEDVLYFDGEASRSHLVRLGNGPPRAQSVTLAHHGAAVAACFDAVGRLAVATDVGRVQLHHVSPTRPDEAPQPLGYLALPPAGVGACRALLPLRGGVGLVARCDRALATWSLGDPHEGAAGYDGLEPTGAQLERLPGALVGLTGDTATRRLVAWSQDRTARHLLPAEGGLVEDCTVERNDGGAPGPQAWAVAEGANVVARVDDAAICLFDLRRSARSPCATLFAGAMPKARLQSVRPLSGSQRWVAASADGYLLVFDAAQPKGPKAAALQFPFCGPLVSQQTVGLEVSPDGLHVAVAGSCGANTSATPTTPARSYAMCQRIDERDLERLEMVLNDRTGPGDFLTDLHFFPQGPRLLLRNDRQLFVWRPNRSDTVVEQILLDDAAVDARRLAVGAALEDDVTQQSYARTLPAKLPRPRLRKPVEGRFGYQTEFFD